MLEVEFRNQSYFPMILIFGTIFRPTFKILSRTGQNLGILTPSNELFFQKSHTCNFEKFIWGTYRWAIKMMFGSFSREMNVVYAHKPNFSYFDPGRPCHMPLVNIWGQNVKCHQLIHHIWVLQTRFVRDVFRFKCVTWAS